MKFTLTIVFIILIAGSSFAQTNAFETLHDKFKGEQNVFSVSASGFVARSIFWLAGEHDYRKAVKHVDRFRMITIPKMAFKVKDVTLNGFKKFISSDYELLTSARDHGDNMSLYIKQADRNKENNRYLLLVDTDDEVVAFEIIGYINPEFVLRESQLSNNKKPS
jgi:hypothetical protein